MARVVVTRPLPPGALDPLAGHDVVVPQEGEVIAGERLRRELAEAEALVCLLTDRIDRSLLDSARRLRVVANVAVGYDNIDLAAAAERGVVVCNTPGVLDETTADLAFALVLAAARRLSEAEAELRGGHWAGWDLLQHLGQDVHGAILGLVGYGRIGRAVARRARGFSMEVLHHARRPTGEEGFVADLDELLARSDAVSLHVPLTDETRHLIDDHRLRLMRPTAVLVNTSRGAVVDEEALALALHEGRLFAAGLDVYESEPAVHPLLLTAPHTVLLPHIASATVATRTAMARMAAEGVRAVLAGETPPNVVPPPAPPDADGGRPPR
jgi:glyoxylate reductase